MRPRLHVEAATASIRRNAQSFDPVAVSGVVRLWGRRRLGQSGATPGSVAQPHADTDADAGQRPRVVQLQPRCPAHGAECGRDVAADPHLVADAGGPGAAVRWRRPVPADALWLASDFVA